MKLSRLAISSVIVLCLVGSTTAGIAQAAPITVAAKAKAVKKCTLKKKASCKSKGVTKQKVGKSDLSGIKLSKGKVTGSKFTGTKLIKADFSGAIIQDTTFSGVNLTDATFKGATLKNVTFSAGTNLSSVDMSNAKISNVNFDHANVSGSSNVVRRSLVASSSTCTFDRGQCSGVNFSNSTIGVVSFAYSNPSNSDFSNSDIVKFSVHYGGGSNLNLASAKIDELSLMYTQISSSNFSNAKIKVARILYSDFNQNQLVGTHFDGLTVNFSHMNANTYVNTICGSTSHFLSDFLSSYYLWSDGCKSEFSNVNGAGNVVNSGGTKNLVLTSEDSTQVSKVIVERSGQGALYRTTCGNLTTCNSFLDIGISARVQIFSKRLVDVVATGWTCSAPSLQSDDQYFTLCQISSVDNIDYTIDISGPPQVRVNGISFENPSRAQVFKSIVIKANGVTVKTCVNTSTCSSEVRKGVSISIYVTSDDGEIWIQQSSPVLDQSLGNFDAISSGVYHSHTNPITVDDSVVFQAMLS